MITHTAVPVRYVNIIARWNRLTEEEAREVSALLRSSRAAHYGMTATRGEYDDYGSYGLRVGTRKRIA